MSATIKLEKKHFPVLLDELISIISPLYSGTFIDCTFGQGGYSKKILSHKENKIIALDRDSKTIKEATKLKKKFKSRFFFENVTFSEIHKIKVRKENIKGIIFDLGYSTSQINDPSKGISFKNKGRRNMRMGINNFSAHEVVNLMDFENLSKIFYYFGEEVKSKAIAKKILLERNKKEIYTEDLVKIINDVKKFDKKKIHKATKVFQSLRIVVNQEITQLIYGLINGFKILPKGGIMAVVTFHSLEDRIVKYFFKNYSETKNTSRYLPEKKFEKKLFKIINKKPIIPSFNEINVNPSSRSAKLRCVEKINDANNFESFIKKFEYLTEIENLANNL